MKNAVSYISSFEDALAHFAEERGVDGVVCGHIHHAEIRKIDNILYCNDGDWVESCSAMFEHEDGRLELIHWTPNESEQPLLLMASSETDSNESSRKAA